MGSTWGDTGMKIHIAIEREHIITGRALCGKVKYVNVYWTHAALTSKYFSKVDWCLACKKSYNANHAKKGKLL